MTSLKKLLAAYNMKEQRRNLGISQAALTERIETSTHYIAMIGLGRKTPSLVTLERIALALQLDPPELFSMRAIPSKSLKNMQKSVLADIEKAVGDVINEHLKAVEDSAEASEGEVKNSAKCGK